MSIGTGELHLLRGLLDGGNRGLFTGIMRILWRMVAEQRTTTKGVSCQSPHIFLS